MFSRLDFLCQKLKKHIFGLFLTIKNYLRCTGWKYKHEKEVTLLIFLFNTPFFFVHHKTKKNCAFFSAYSLSLDVYQVELNMLNQNKKYSMMGGWKGYEDYIP